MVNQYGGIVPSAQDLNAAVEFLLNGLDNDPAVNVKFRTSPTDYFSAIGIPTDGIPEVMRELGLNQEAACFSACWHTCWFTGCAITSIVVNRSVKVTASTVPFGG